MTRARSFAAVPVTVSLGLLFAACSGSSGVTIPDTVTATDSGTTVTPTDSGTATDSGTECGICAPLPDPSCTVTNPCTCAYTCPDSGTAVEPCTWAAADPCGAGKYCYAPGCGAGHCVAIAATENNANASPQCGCNGVTYWNPSVAVHDGMSVRKAGECAGGDVAKCSSGPLSGACAVGTCSMVVKNANDCPNGLGGKADGTCWMTPATCGPASATNPAVHTCGSAACPTECAAIKTGTPYYSADAMLCPAH